MVRIGLQVSTTVGHGVPDVVICQDVDVPERRSAHPAARLVALTAAASRRNVSALLRSGVTGVVAQDAPPAAVAAAALAVATGSVVVPASTVEPHRQLAFTTRQKEVLRLLVLECSNAEIGQRLHLSESTVKLHVSAILRLLDVSTRREAVDLVLDPASSVGASVLRGRSAVRGEGGYKAPKLG